FEVYLDGPQGPRWYTFDARHDARRIGRVVIARGRDATDVAISTSFGTTLLAQFDVHTLEGVGLLTLALIGLRSALNARAQLRRDRTRLRELASLALEGLAVCDGET
ncbi:hypothetical protein MKK68_11900, partial [Methylobacterium sp. E-016]|nr:hypothetical protein [Methylobacterium sp. E-016]